MGVILTKTIFGFHRNIYSPSKLMEWLTWRWIRKSSPESPNGSHPAKLVPGIWPLNSLYICIIVSTFGYCLYKTHARCLVSEWQLLIFRLRFAAVGIWKRMISRELVCQLSGRRWVYCSMLNRLTHWLNNISRVTMASSYLSLNISFKKMSARNLRKVRESVSLPGSNMIQA